MNRLSDPDQAMYFFPPFASLGTVGDISQHISPLLDLVEGVIGGLQGHGVSAVDEVRVVDFDDVWANSIFGHVFVCFHIKLPLELYIML